MKDKDTLYNPDEPQQRGDREVLPIQNRTAKNNKKFYYPEESLLRQRKIKSHRIGKSIEATLEMSVKKYKTLFDLLPFGINICDNNGNIIETSGKHAV